MGKKPRMRTAIFLGAGASAAEGAPLQSHLFYDYFNSLPQNGIANEMDRELATFFDIMFGVNVDNKENLRPEMFPTFEEALGILDLAEGRKESLKDFDLESLAVNSNRIRFVRQYLIMLMAKVIDDKLQDSGPKHRELVDKLRRAKRIKDTTFITTNYDILVDNALTALYDNDVMLDYEIDFTNFDRTGDWKRPNRSAIKLYKVHGSLNWLLCRTCNTPRFQES
jgi:hypothetical protein